MKRPSPDQYPLDFSPPPAVEEPPVAKESPAVEQPVIPESKPERKPAAPRELKPQRKYEVVFHGTDQKPKVIGTVSAYSEKQAQFIFFTRSGADAFTSISDRLRFNDVGEAPPRRSHPKFHHGKTKAA